MRLALLDHALLDHGLAVGVQDRRQPRAVEGYEAVQARQRLHVSCRLFLQRVDQVPRESLTAADDHVALGHGQGGLEIEPHVDRPLAGPGGRGKRGDRVLDAGVLRPVDDQARFGLLPAGEIDQAQRLLKCLFGDQRELLRVLHAEHSGEARQLNLRRAHLVVVLLLGYHEPHVRRGLGQHFIGQVSAREEDAHHVLEEDQPRGPFGEQPVFRRIELVEIAVEAQGGDLPRDREVGHSAARSGVRRSKFLGRESIAGCAVRRHFDRQLLVLDVHAHRQPVRLAHGLQQRREQERGQRVLRVLGQRGLHVGDLFQHGQIGVNAAHRVGADRLAGAAVIRCFGHAGAVRIGPQVHRRLEPIGLVGQHQAVADDGVRFVGAELPAGHAAVLGGHDGIRLAAFFGLAASDHARELVDFLQQPGVFGIDDQQAGLVGPDGPGDAAAKQFANQAAEVDLILLLVVLDRARQLFELGVGRSGLVLGRGGDRAGNAIVQEGLQQPARLSNVHDDHGVLGNPLGSRRQRLGGRRAAGQEKRASHDGQGEKLARHGCSTPSKIALAETPGRQSDGGQRGDTVTEKDLPKREILVIAALEEAARVAAGRLGLPAPKDRHDLVPLAL